MKKNLFPLLIAILVLSPLNIYAKDTSRSAVVIDMDSGRILYEKNKDDQALIASTTKIMTAVIAIENNNLNEIVDIGEEVLPMYGSNIYIEVGEQISLRDLLYGLILRSGNDAAVSIAKHVSGSEERFVNLMNQKAKKIGMTNTIFNNCHGLDDETENYSTAYDMAKLMIYANNLIEFVEISGTEKWMVTTNKKSYVWHNRNKLLKEYKYTTGGKTGYTPKAGKTLVSTASKNDLNLVAVTLNDPNHYETQKELFDYIFSKYHKELLINKNDFNINKGNYDELYVNYNFSYPLKNDELSKIEKTVNLYQIQDYRNNQKVGEIVITFDKKEVYRENIYAKKYNQKKDSFFEKLLSFFHSLF